MRPFTIVAPITGASSQEVDMALSASMRFFLSLSKKQRLASRLVLLDNGKQSASVVFKLQAYKFRDLVQVIIQPEKEAQISATRHADLLFLPRLHKRTKWIRMALYHGLAVVTFDSPIRSTLLDDSFAMFVPVKSRERNVAAFADIFRMLFFDPGAQQALKRGALKRYNTEPAKSGSGLILTSAA